MGGAGGQVELLGAVAGDVEACTDAVPQLEVPRTRALPAAQLVQEGRDHRPLLQTHGLGRGGRVAVGLQWCCGQLEHCHHGPLVRPGIPTTCCHGVPVMVTHAIEARLCRSFCCNSATGEVLKQSISISRGFIARSSFVPR